MRHEKIRREGSPASPSREALVSVRALHKSYLSGNTVSHAVCGIDLTVGRGEIVGVLGPNGAGKTTTISIIEGLIAADAGTVRVFGQDIADRPAMAQVRQRLGVSMQNGVLPPLLTVQELVQLKAALHDAPRAVEPLLSALGLQEKRGVQYRHLSGGQQQRTVLAMALVGDPELMFLDEPTSQLDPQARRAVWDLLVEQRAAREAAVLITTHQMEEAQRLCDRVLIIDKGRIIAEGAPAALVARFCPDRSVRFTTAATADLTFLEDATLAPPDKDGMVDVTVKTGSFELVLAALLDQQRAGTIAVADLQITSQSLEDVFIALTGREIHG